MPRGDASGVAVKQMAEPTNKIYYCPIEVAIDLIGDGLVERRELAELPPPVEYSLTVFGRRLIPSLDQLREIGLEVARRQGVLIDDPWDLAQTAERTVWSKVS